jgi:Flp pilus assembly CpaF family ATPase
MTRPTDLPSLPPALTPRAEAVLDDLLAQGVGDEVAGWRDNAVAAGQPVTAEDQRRFATSVIQDRLRLIAERDIANGIMAMTDEEDAQVLRAALDDMFGAGVLDRLMTDPLVENIDAFGCDRVWITRADGTKVLGPPLWRTDDAMTQHLRRLGARAGQSERRFDNGAFKLRVQLANGARLFAVMSVTTRPCVSVRQHRKATATLAELRTTGMFDRRVEDFLRAAVLARLNVLIAGATNAGKTTLLRALLGEVDPSERLITIEENRELGLDQFPDRHPDVISMEARDANTEGEGGVSLAELVRLSLSMNPSRVIVGEVLGDEVIPMLNAMSQGNDGSMCTIHAASSEGVFDRVASYCIQAPERLNRVAANLMLVNAVDLIVFIGKHTTDAGVERRVASIREVVAADENTISSNEIFRAGTDGSAEPSGVPLRAATAERLRDVGYSWPPVFEVVR